ncbi:MAG: ceramidase [Gammaproteobacteria bacterium]|nr:ceramidase [Gammaproteobacteria bacterium]
MSTKVRLKVLQVLTLTILVAVFFVEPISQDAGYHQFADGHTKIGIPNAWNVLSNIPFVIIGIFCFVVAKKHLLEKALAVHKMPVLIFFVGLILTGFGSAYYHLLPTNETLLWDRLPMTISFMAFFSFILSFHLNRKLGRAALWPLLLIGVLSVFYWAYTETEGFGDLRFYAVVQFLPIVLIPLILLLFPVTNYQQKYIWLILGLYLTAKLVENFDADIYHLLGISGHTLKHVIASFSGVAFLLAVWSISRYDNGTVNNTIK